MPSMRWYTFAEIVTELFASSLNPPFSICRSRDVAQIEGCDDARAYVHTNRNKNVCAPVVCKLYGFWNWLQPEYNMSITTTNHNSIGHFVFRQHESQGKSEMSRMGKKKMRRVAVNSIRVLLFDDGDDDYVWPAHSAQHSHYDKWWHRKCCRVYWFSDGLQLRWSIVRFLVVVHIVCGVWRYTSIGHTETKRISHSCKFTFPYKSRFDGFLACAIHPLAYTHTHDSYMRNEKSKRQTPSERHSRHRCAQNAFTHFVDRNRFGVCVSVSVALTNRK